MSRAFLPTLIAATLLLTACTQATAPAPATPPATQPPVSDKVPDPTPSPDSPKPDPSTPAPGSTTDANAPGRQPPAGTPAGQNPAPTQVDPQPFIKWYPRGIGLPLTSDDPAAQGKKVVVLTFDDGPNPGTTDRILDVLAENNVKAMFFITGYGMKHRDLVEREYREGHVLGPHTMTHANLSELSVPEMRAELEPVNKVIEEVTGSKPHWLRPPFGAYNDALINLSKEYGMEVLNWSDGSLDWDGVKDGYKDPNKVIEDTMKQLHPGAVILMHDTLKHTAEALPELIKRIKAEGYEFTVLR